LRRGQAARATVRDGDPTALPGEGT
jgi:hypothetical protein